MRSTTFFCSSVSFFGEQIVVLGEQRDEVEAQLLGGRLDAEADIGHAARHRGRHREVGELFRIEAGDFATLDALVREQSFEREPRAGTALALRTAEGAGITLVAIVRDDGFEIFTDPDRIRIEASARAA